MSQSATIESVQDQIALQLGITLPPFGLVPPARTWTRASLISDNLKNLGRCLFLLDDIAFSLFSMGIPEERTGSSCNCKVVLTTRSSQVCEHIGAHKQIRVSPLSENEAWDLFVSRSGNHVLDSEIRNIAELIVYECKGLPIAVITIAHAMREVVSTITWRRALKDIRRALKDIRSTDDKRTSVLLRFGYSHLKNERVQKCFLYCALFPEDFQFEARELIRYWIVEELICKESIVASIDEGYQILKEITDANMLEPVMRGGDGWVRMHDLFRDLAVSIMNQEIQEKSFVDKESDFRDLRMMEAEIRLQLRTNGGHRGKVSQEMLIWLDDFKRMEDQMKRLEAQKRAIQWMFCACYSRFKVDRAEVKLVPEVKSLLEKASSLLVSYANNAIGRVAEQLVSPTLVGKSAQSILNQVCDYLADPTIGIIALYGEGGVGKTTIMKNLNNLFMNTDLFDKIIWVTMSQSATIQSVQDQIALQLGITLPSIQLASPVIRSTRASLISDNLKNLGRCLFLLDDMGDGITHRVWDDDANSLLARIGIPEKRMGSSCNCKVVLTTRSYQLCLQMWVHKLIRVSPLSENEAWDLFISRSGNHVLDSEIQNIAEQIVYECKGLPITVITLAHAMREEVSTITWRRALEDIRSTNDVDVDVDKRISDLLRFGYSHLKNKRVQKCFLYCAFFPEDFQFEARELIQYWIVEELICKESIVASIDEGYQILKEITDANMLEPVMRDGDAWVRMHDLFRDLAVSIMTQELGFSVQAGQHVSEFNGLPTNKKKASVIRSQINHLYFQGMMYGYSNLSTLLLRDNPLSNYSDSSFFYQLRNLQVLDMSYTGIIELPDSVYQLSKLRVLFLQYCTNLEKLQSLEYCKELQFLNLRGTLIRKLPPGMEKLIQLRSLDLSETVRLGNIQKGLISSLSNLQELHMQGSLLCKLESPTIASRLKEIRCLEKLAILTLSAVGFEDHVDTILHLQGHSLTSFSINVYGSTQDYSEDV